MPKTKSGEVISWKEFMHRWKQGIEGITPLQQVNVQIQATYISMLGMVIGFIISLSAFGSLWWLSIILLGAFGNTWIQQLGLYQRKISYETIERMVVSL